MKTEVDRLSAGNLVEIQSCLAAVWGVVKW